MLPAWYYLHYCSFYIFPLIGCWMTQLFVSVFVFVFAVAATATAAAATAFAVYVACIICPARSYILFLGWLTVVWDKCTSECCGLVIEILSCCCLPLLYLQSRHFCWICPMSWKSSRKMRWRMKMMRWRMKMRRCILHCVFFLCWWWSYLCCLLCQGWFTFPGGFDAGSIVAYFESFCVRMEMDGT